MKIVAPGYVTNTAMAIGVAAGCALGAGPANITTIAVGSGSFGGGSFLFGNTTTGIHFLL